MDKSFQEQVKRMIRGYNRFPEKPRVIKDIIYNPWKTTPELIDHLHHFFQDCYHLKDWIKNDPEVIKKNKGYRGKSRRLCNK